MPARTPARPTARLLHVRVQPRARQDEVVGWEDGTLRVRVTAAPRDGEANRAVTRVLADTFGVPRLAPADAAASTPPARAGAEASRMPSSASDVTESRRERSDRVAARLGRVGMASFRGGRGPRKSRRSLVAAPGQVKHASLRPGQQGTARGPRAD